MFFAHFFLDSCILLMCWRFCAIWSKKEFRMEFLLLYRWLRYFCLSFHSIKCQPKKAAFFFFFFFCDKYIYNYFCRLFLPINIIIIRIPIYLYVYDMLCYLWGICCILWKLFTHIYYIKLWNYFSIIISILSRVKIASSFYLLGCFKSKETDSVGFIAKIHFLRYVNSIFMSKNSQNFVVLEYFTKTDIFF